MISHSAFCYETSASYTLSDACNAEIFTRGGMRLLGSQVATSLLHVWLQTASVISPFSGYLPPGSSVLCYGVPERGRPDVPHTRQGAF